MYSNSCVSFKIQARGQIKIQLILCLPCTFPWFAFISSPSSSIVRGPWARGYSLISLLTSRLFLVPLMHPWSHLEIGFPASHILIWQWTNTNGWSVMNLNPSVVNREMPTLVNGKTMVVSSTEHLQIIKWNISSDFFSFKIILRKINILKNTPLKLAEKSRYF